MHNPKHAKPAMNPMCHCLLLLTLLLTCGHAAPLSISSPFTDNAVIQRESPVSVRGTAGPNKNLTVTLGSHSRVAQSDSEGRWRVVFPAHRATAKPYRGVELSVSSDGQKIVLRNLLFGDVWLASGQSNMRWEMRQSTSGKESIAEASDPALRLLKFSGTLHPGSRKYPREFLRRLTPANYYQSDGWQASSPQSADRFSAVAYHFARKLREETGIPIGVVQLAVGGSPIEAHLPQKAFEKDPKLSVLLDKWWKNPQYPSWCRQRAVHNLTHWLTDPPTGQSLPHPFAPSFLWQAGILPLTGYPVKGVIWYQGESNAGKDGSPEAGIDGSLNKHKFASLIKSWRHFWKNDKLPVYFVQLPGLNRRWPVFREMQLEVSREIPHTGMAVTIDCGHPTNVHPPRKKPVGERLARLALAGVYKKKIVPNGPIYQRHVIRGGKVYLKFDHSEGMTSADGMALRGFEIAGNDRKFLPAKVKVDGDHLQVWHDQIVKPAAVRYAWANDPDGNLVNAARLPASPFRTDRWKITP